MENPSQFKIKDRLQTDQKEAARASVRVDQDVPDDMEFRLRLAKSIGLDKVPDLDPEAFDRIKGIWAKDMGPSPFDAVEAVREVRSW